VVPLLFDAWDIPGWAEPLSAAVAWPDVLEGGGGRVTLRYPLPSEGWVGGLAAGLRSKGPASGELRERVRLLGDVGARFLDPEDAVRREALDFLPATAGLSKPMARVVLDGMARDWCTDRLETLVREEFGADPPFGRLVRRGTRRVMAVPPALAVQVVSGSVPGVGITAMLRTLLLGAPTLLKPGLGDAVLPVLFARALRESAPSLADRLCVLYWPGGEGAITRAAVKRAEVVTAYGGDDAVRAVREATPVTARFLAYHHREGAGVVGAGALDSEAAAALTARDVARAVAVFDQRGCVSPRVVWVEDTDAGVTPSHFARLLAVELESLERTLPSGSLERLERSAVHQFRGTAELLAAGWGSGDDAEDRPRLVHGGPAPWTVFYDPYRALESNCVGRVVVVRPFRSVPELISRLEPLGDHLQTVGVAGLGDRLEAVSVALGQVGASRVTPFEAVPFPRPWWHHDGGKPLADLVRWVESVARTNGPDRV